jgi:hypothetical protein
MLRRSKTQLDIGLGRNKRAEDRPEISIDSSEPSAWPPVNPILRHLKKHFKARETSRVKCPATDQGVYELSIEEHGIVLEQSDRGDITIYAKDGGAENLLERMAESLKAVAG